MAQRFVVTGGAGFVGSHLVLALMQQGAEVVVVDNLVQGHRDAVLAPARLVVGDAADPAVLDAAFAGGPVEAVFHFAARSLVGESMKKPVSYLRDNLAVSLSVAEAAIAHGCRKFVFSSTANLFGLPETLPIDETATIDPGSPYGESKYLVERSLTWLDKTQGLRSACLRYFNAAGADPDGRLGEDHRPETHLIPIVIDAALGRRGPVEIFGEDYPTPDGTCIRDYVHVADLADAHLRVLGALDQQSVRYNLGVGAGFSVREVIHSVERVSGRKVPHQVGPRRPGDPAALVASPAALSRDLGWSPAWTELDRVIETALRWRELHPDGYGLN